MAVSRPSAKLASPRLRHDRVGLLHRVHGAVGVFHHQVLHDAITATPQIAFERPRTVLATVDRKDSHFFGASFNVATASSIGTVELVALVVGRTHCRSSTVLLCKAQQRVEDRLCTAAAGDCANRRDRLTSCAMHAIFTRSACRSSVMSISPTTRASWCIRRLEQRRRHLPRVVVDALQVAGAVPRVPLVKAAGALVCFARHTHVATTERMKSSIRRLRQVRAQRNRLCGK